MKLKIEYDDKGYKVHPLSPLAKVASAFYLSFITYLQEHQQGLSNIDKIILGLPLTKYIGLQYWWAITLFTLDYLLSYQHSC
jgi:hypothetical protein